MAKSKTSWKQKTQYRILAPESFNQQEVGATVAISPNTLIGRTIKISLKDLSGDRSKQHLNLIFDIDKVDENKAKTKFKRFYISPNYIRSKIRKGMNKIECVNTLRLKDESFRIKVVVITHRSIQKSKERDISTKVSKIITKHKSLNANDFLQSALFGKLGTEIYHVVKKIALVKRVEVEEIRRL